MTASQLIMCRATICRDQSSVLTTSGRSFKRSIGYVAGFDDLPKFVYAGHKYRDVNFMKQL